MQEDVRVDADGRAHFPTGLRTRSQCAAHREDIPAGSVVLPRGRRLRPQDVAVCAVGSINGVPFMGLPGNPVASFVTFVCLARAAVLALAGAVSEPFTATPVRAAFAYRKKAGRREYARAKIRRGADGALEAVKFPREGAGLLSSLIETDGLVELPES